MGRAGNKRRTRYHRLPPVRSDVDLGDWARSASPYLIESRIEDYGRFARGLRTAPRWARAVSWVFVALALVPLVAAVVSVLR